GRLHAAVEALAVVIWRNGTTRPDRSVGCGRAVSADDCRGRLPHAVGVLLARGRLRRRGRAVSRVRRLSVLFVHAARTGSRARGRRALPRPHLRGADGVAGPRRTRAVVSLGRRRTDPAGDLFGDAAADGGCAGRVARPMVAIVATDG